MQKRLWKLNKQQKEIAENGPRRSLFVRSKHAEAPPPVDKIRIPRSVTGSPESTLTGSGRGLLLFCDRARGGRPKGTTKEAKQQREGTRRKKAIEEGTKGLLDGHASSNISIRDAFQNLL